MKWMLTVAAMSVTAALAFGAAGCAKKEEATPADAPEAGTMNGLILIPDAPSETLIPDAPSETLVPDAPSETLVPDAPSETVIPDAPSETPIPDAPSETK